MAGAIKTFFDLVQNHNSFQATDSETKSHPDDLAILMTEADDAVWHPGENRPVLVWWPMTTEGAGNDG
jgi:hypothetical protein